MTDHSKTAQDRDGYHLRIGDEVLYVDPGGKLVPTVVEDISSNLPIAGDSWPATVSEPRRRVRVRGHGWVDPQKLQHR